MYPSQCFIFLPCMLAMHVMAEMFTPVNPYFCIPLKVTFVLDKNSYSLEGWDPLHKGEVVFFGCSQQADSTILQPLLPNHRSTKPSAVLPTTEEGSKIYHACSSTRICFPVAAFIWWASWTPSTLRGQRRGCTTVLLNSPWKNSERTFLCKGIATMIWWLMEGKKKYGWDGHGENIYIFSLAEINNSGQH